MRHDFDDLEQPTSAETKTKKTKKFVFLGALVAVCLAVGQQIFAHLASKGIDDIHADREISTPIDDCDDERITLMTRGFMMSKDQGSPVRVNATVRLVDRDKQAMVWPRVYLLEKRRLHVKPEDFVTLGYDVYYDQNSQVVMMRYQHDPACIVFNCRGNDMSRVAAYWSRDPFTFEQWMTGFKAVQIIANKPSVNAYWAKCPPCFDPNDPAGEMQIPLRVLAGAAGAVPNTDQVAFVSGNNPGEPLQNATVNIQVPDPVSQIRQMVGKYDPNWHVPDYLNERFREKEKL